jgi:DNA modification methylase
MTLKDTILYGDCRETLNNLTNLSIQTCVTSPPYYGLRDYGGEKNQIGQEQSPEEFIDELVKVFRIVRDKLKDDGTLWVNIGDSYYNYRPSKGKSYPKQTVSKTKQDLPDYSSKRNNKLSNYKEKDLIGIPFMLAFALRNDGWYLRQDIIWHKPNPMPESVRDRCTKAHEYIFLLSKSKKYYYDNEAIKEPVKQDWGTRNRANGKYHNSGSGLSPHTGLTKSYTTKNKRSVWSITNKPYKHAHFATFPPDLIEPCILAGSKEGDIVLDPFMGSGTTAMVSKQHNRHFIGCELHEEYGDLIQQRMPPEILAQDIDNPLTQMLY